MALFASFNVKGMHFFNAFILALIYLAPFEQNKNAHI
jgi:hypothetical protein